MLAHPTLLPGPHSHILLCFFVLALLVQRNASYMGGTKEMGVSGPMPEGAWAQGVAGHAVQYVLQLAPAQKM